MDEKTVLLVEDDPAHEALFRRAIEGSEVSCRLEVVHDGVEAVEYLFATGAYQDRNPKQAPDLILLDLRLPRMNGFQVLQVLRRAHGDRRKKVPPVVVLTSSESDQDMVKAYELGAQSYICKPMDFAEFSKTVSATLSYWLGLNHPAPNRVLNFAGRTV